MGSLELVLERIEELRKDLSAEVVIREEEGHYEYEAPRGYRGDLGRGLFYPEDYNKVWVVPRITKPDTQKREAARTELQRIREKSGWIAARYEARSTLEGMGFMRIDDEVNLWFDEMKNNLGVQVASSDEYSVENDLRILYENNVPANHELRKKAGELLRINEANILGHELTIGLNLGYGWNKNKVYGVYQNATHIEYRKLASRLSGKSSADFLADELRRSEELSRPQIREIYRQATNQEDRVAAGRSLGYSGARIWLHEKLLQVNKFLN